MCVDEEEEGVGVHCDVFPSWVPRECASAARCSHAGLLMMIMIGRREEQGVAVCLCVCMCVQGEGNEWIMGEIIKIRIRRCAQINCARLYIA